MQIKRTFKFRIYPSKSQQTTIDLHLELCRNLYNELLNVKKETYEQSKQSLTKFDLNKCMFYFNNRNPEFKLIHSQVKQNISDRIDKAFKNMFARIKRGEDKVGFPRFKGKGRYKSICYPQSGYIITHTNKLKVSKIGDINIKLHRQIKGDIKTLTITQTATNKYYATFSCVVDVEHKSRPIQHNKSVGIDVGLNHYLTTSDSMKIDNPRFYRKSESKLAHVQRVHSKRKLGSNNRKKSRLKVALCHEKIKHQRTDFLHKLSCDLVNNYGLIGIENLNIKGMVKNHHLSKSINDAGWGIFTHQLHYKAEYAGSVIHNSDRFYPSSKLCNKCGNKMNMPLHKRTFRCDVCGNIEDRDTNAAKNLENNAIINTAGMAGINACGDVGINTIPELTSLNQEAPSLNHPSG